MRRRSSPWSTILILLLLLPLAFSRVLRMNSPHYSRQRSPRVSAVTEPEFSGRCVGISDGDTIRVMHSGREERIRLFGVDCPELHQAFGSAARKFTSRMVFGRSVTVEVEEIDRYGRTVGQVVLEDGRVLNEELVKSGLAWWYRKYAPDDDELAAFEKQAKTAGRGLWTEKRPVPPWEYRRRQR